jgi:hypothetical protein
VNPDAVGGFILADSDPDLHPRPADPELDRKQNGKSYLDSDQDRQQNEADLQKLLKTVSELLIGSVSDPH